MLAGWITIKTDLETDKFDKKYKRLEEDKAKLENKKIKIEADIETNEKELKNYDELKNKANEYKLKLQEIAEAKKQETLANPEQVITYGGTDKYKQLVQEEAEIRAELSNVNSELNTAEKTVDSTANKNEILKEKLAEINSQLQKNNEEMNKVKLEQHRAEVEKVKKGFDNVGNSIQSTVKQAGRMVLSIFGIRSAVMTLRSASSTLSTYDQQYASNLEYIRFVLAQMIAPVLQWIISLASTLLNYLYYILNAWFGIGKSVNVSANAFKKAKVGASGVDKSTKSTAKNMKEINKQTAGFDEMEVLQDNSNNTGGSTGGGGAGESGFTAPSLDIGGMKDVPPWLKWIADNKGIVIAGLVGIAAGLLAVKAGATALQAIGIGIAIAGIVLLIQDIISFIKDPTWEGFANILRDIGIILIGIGIAIGGFPGLIVAVIGVIALIVSAVIENWDTIKGVLSKVGSWINDNIIQPVANFFKGLWDNIKTGVTNGWNAVSNFITSIPGWINDNIIQPVVNFFVSLWQNITTGVTNGWNTVVGIIQGVANWINTNIIQPIINFFVGMWNNIKSGVSNLWNGVIGIIQGVANWINTHIIQPIIGFFNNMWNNIRGGLSNIGNFFSNIFNGMRNIAINVINAVINVFHSLSNVVSGVMNGIWSIIKNIINFITAGINILIRGINKISFDAPDWVPLVGGKKWGFNIPQIPRLKTGGIVNIPNRGVNIGGAIAGESGQEGVLPLTDPQTMAQLGEEIGKWITVNATITNTMNGRTISRQIQKINADRDFAMNN